MSCVGICTCEWLLFPGFIALFHQGKNFICQPRLVTTGGSWWWPWMRRAWYQGLLLGEAAAHSLRSGDSADCALCWSGATGWALWLGSAAAWILCSGAAYSQTLYLSDQVGLEAALLGRAMPLVGFFDIAALQAMLCNHFRSSGSSGGASWLDGATAHWGWMWRSGKPLAVLHC